MTFIENPTKALDLTPRTGSKSKTCVFQKPQVPDLGPKPARTRSFSVRQVYPPTGRSPRNKSWNKGLISADRNNKGYSTAYNTPFALGRLQRILRRTALLSDAQPATRTRVHAQPGCLQVFSRRSAMRTHAARHGTAYPARIPT